MKLSRLAAPWMRPAPIAAVCVATAIGLSASTTAAQECDPVQGLSSCVDADNLWVHPGPRTFYSVGGGATTAPGQFSFELLLGYLSRPIGVRVNSPDPEGTELFLVDNLLNAQFLFALGLTDRLELTLASPVTLFQDGPGIGQLVGSGEEVPRSVVRDPRFGYALAIIDRSRTGQRDGLSLVQRLEFSAPLGDENYFAGARTMTAIPTVAAEYRQDELTLGGQFGARIRGESEFANARWGSQLYFGLGASYDLIGQDLLEVGAEGYLLYTMAEQAPLRSSEPAEPLIPAEWMLTAATAPFLGGDVRFQGSGGGALPFTGEAALTAPRFRFNLSVAYAPQGLDFDADGVPDRDDACPKSPEDLDGFEDADGCPDNDNDQDGILDVDDRCRDDAETVDGYRDEDGCPDNDDDGDGIDDDLDQCRNEPEDRDGVQDDDGCPETDNDEDGIPDSEDKCPSGPEDKDGYRDDDGCPDPDNDLDQIPDDDDACSNEAEDKDGFEDQDGCPEPDNDRDGVSDESDQCPTEAETLNGVDDDDGCPEPGAKSTVRFDDGRIAFDKPQRFAPGSAVITDAMGAQLRLAARLAQSRAPLSVVIVEGFPDRAGDESAAATMLSAKRAEAVKAQLVEEGVKATTFNAAAGDPSERRPAGAAQFQVSVQPTKPNPTAGASN